MFGAPQLINDVQHINWGPALAKEVLWPALATLVPAAVLASVKWLQDHSESRRRAALSDRMLVLAKSISDFPSGEPFGAEARSVLSQELVMLASELKTLHSKSEKRIATGQSFGATAVNRLCEATLFYRPYGFTAWMLHIVFYLYTGCLLLAIAAVMSVPPRPPLADSLVGFAVLGIPPLILRHYASKLHRAHCRAVAGIAIPPPSVLPKSA